MVYFKKKKKNKEIVYFKKKKEAKNCNFRIKPT